VTRQIPAITSLLIASLAPAMYAQDLPEGKGKDVVENICGSCHPVSYVFGRRATKEGWGYVVDDMVSRGASATNEQIKTINEYLAKNFGQVNANKAPAAEIAGVLEITADQADAIVKYRKDRGDFKTLDDVKKVPGLASANLDAKKDRIVFN
jgi:competence ComEA-like helix-hairpin-helix protein